MVDAQLVEDGGVEIANVDWVFDDVVAVLVGLAVLDAALDSSSGHPGAEASWVVVSGGDQEELRELFRERELTEYFDGGIFGSPSTKETLLEECFREGIIKYPALYIGDTRHDHEVSSAVGLDFLFVEEWSEFVGWKEYQKRVGFQSVTNISKLLDSN